jgi:hypothetical protein
LGALWKETINIIRFSQLLRGVELWNEILQLSWWLEMVFLEEFAAPPGLLIHMVTFVGGALFWFLGFVIMLIMFRNGSFQSLHRTANRMFVIGGVLFAVGFTAGGLLYPAFRLNVLSGPLVVNLAFPYVSLSFDGVFLFIVKQWVAAVGGLALVGTVVFNSGDKRKTLISLSMCLIVLATVLIDTFIAIILTATSAL